MKLTKFLKISMEEMNQQCLCQAKTKAKIRNKIIVVITITRITITTAVTLKVVKKTVER